MDERELGGGNMIQITNCIEKFTTLILGELSKNGITCWVAGGAVRDYFMGKPVKTDIDIFFPDESNWALCKEYFIKNGGEVKWESDNGMKVKLNGKTFDLIKKYFVSPVATIEAFDFTVSMFAVDVNNVYYQLQSFIDLSKRQLMINKITYPASTLSRAFRYYQKGFAMCSGEMKKIHDAIQSSEPVAPQETDADTTTEQSSADFAAFFTGID